MQLFKPSIRNYVIGFLCSLVVLLGIYFSIVIYFKAKEDSDTLVINVAGRNRMLSQKIAFQAELLSKGDVSIKSSIEECVAAHEKSLIALKNGGKAPGFNEGELPEAPDEIMATVKRVESLWKPFSENVKSVISLANVNGQSTDQDQFKKSLKFIEDNAEMMLNYNNALVLEFVQVSENRKQTFIWALVSISIFVLFFFAFSFYLLRKNILLPLRNISNTADEVADGEFDQKLPPQADPYLNKITTAVNDLGVNINQASQFAATIGGGNFEYQFNSVRGGNKLFIELEKMRDQLKNVAEEDRKRNWVSNGLAKFTDILRNDQKSIQELSHKIIAECVKYLRANQGSLFVLSEEDGEKFMELTATYAWDRQKHLQKKIRKGESLVGQSWIEKNTIYITEIPENYVRITSGLGEANPRELLIVPLMINEEIFGVIELASFHKFEKYHIDFIEKLGENIASSLSSAQSIKQTAILLEKSQQQAEELGAQEEEIRQNMEEMTATQEQMARNEEDNLRRIKELEDELEAFRIQS